MKREFIACDICGGTVDGRAHIPQLQAVLAGHGRTRAIVSIDLCERHEYFELFDSEIQLLFSGSTQQGDVITFEEREVVAVICEDHASQVTTTYAMDDLSREQREYVDEAVAAIRRVQKKRVDERQQDDLVVFDGRKH